MIIKTGGIKSGDGPRITSYATREAKNERVQVIEDNAPDLLVADIFADLKDRKNGLLHTIISPDQQLSPDELDRTIEAIRSEFGFNPADPEMLTLHESRRADGTLQQHYHLIRPAADSETGKTYKLFRSKAKDEAVSRLLELQFNHTLVSGANNTFAEMRLREQGHDDLADKLAEAFTNQDTQKAAYSSKEHQQAKRRDFDLPALRQNLKELSELPPDRQPEALAALLERESLELSEAITEGRGRSRIMIKTPDGIKDHNANRTLKIKAAEVAEFTSKTREFLNELRSNTAESTSDFNQGAVSPNNQRTDTDTGGQSSYDPTHERPPENPQSDRQALTEADELTSAADELESEIENFCASKSSNLSVSDIEPAPSLNDPNLMMKLARLLKKSLQSFDMN